MKPLTQITIVLLLACMAGVYAIPMRFTDSARLGCQNGVQENCGNPKMVDSNEDKPVILDLHPAHRGWQYDAEDEKFEGHHYGGGGGGVGRRWHSREGEDEPSREGQVLMPARSGQRDGDIADGPVKEQQPQQQQQQQEEPDEVRPPRLYSGKDMDGEVAEEDDD